MTDPSGICRVCGERVPAEEILLHLRVEHGMDVELATWPDGEPVIVDTSLEPSDFEDETP